MRNSTSALIAILTLAMTSLDPSGASSQTVQRWRVSVLVPPQFDRPKPGPVGFWVRLRNDFDKAKLICVSGWSLQIRPQNEGPGASGSPSSCPAPLTSALVLPGESAFKFIEVMPGDLRSPSSRLDISLFAHEADAVAPAELRKKTLEWSGTIKEARDAVQILQK